MILRKFKFIAHIILVFSVKAARSLRGKRTKYPSDPHSHDSLSFEISREIQIGESRLSKKIVESNERLDILPSHLYDFKEVVFVPPVLFSSPPNIVHQFRNAQIIGYNPIALTESSNLIQETLFRTRDRNRPAIAYLYPSDLKVLASSVHRRQKRLSGQYCLLASFWDNFGHWIPEHLLKVYTLIEAGIDISQINFIIRSNPDGFKVELLKAAGISPSQIFFWNQSFLRVENLLVPSYPQITKERLDWISNLVPLRNTSFFDSKNRIYLSRQKQNHRKIINEEEVQEVLQRYNFLTIYPEQLSFVDQVSLARKATLLFGPQGSSFTLQIFMPKGSILEAFPQNRIHLFNRQVAIVKGHKHHVLVDPRGPDSTKHADVNLKVDVSLMEYYLKKII